MKKSILLLSCSLLCLGLSTICTAEETQAKKIRMLFAGEQAVVELDDHPAVRDLLSRLPMTVTFEDYSGMEKNQLPFRKAEHGKLSFKLRSFSGNVCLLCAVGQSFRILPGLQAFRRACAAGTRSVRHGRPCPNAGRRFRTSGN